jgi:hypothetical protein
MPKPQHRYVEALLAAQTDEDRCCFISDAGQLGATVLYRGERWHVLQHFASTAAGADHIALVTLDGEADPAKLNAAALATDSRYEPLWLIDVRAFGELAEYGLALRVLWRSDEA